MPILTKGVHSVPADSNTVRCTVYVTQVIPHYTCHQLPCPWWAVMYNCEVRTVCIYRVANNNVTLKFHCAIWCYKYCVFQSRQWGAYLRYSTRLISARSIIQCIASMATIKKPNLQFPC